MDQFITQQLQALDMSPCTQLLGGQRQRPRMQRPMQHRKWSIGQRDPGRKQRCAAAIIGPTYICMHSINIIPHSNNNRRTHFFLFQGRRFGDKNNNRQNMATSEFAMEQSIRGKYTKVSKLFCDSSNYVMIESYCLNVKFRMTVFSKNLAQACTFMSCRLPIYVNNPIFFNLFF